MTRGGKRRPRPSVASLVTGADTSSGETAPSSDRSKHSTSPRMSHSVSHPRLIQTINTLSPNAPHSNNLPRWSFFIHTEWCVSSVRALHVHVAIIGGRGTISAVSQVSNRAPCCYQLWALETDELRRGSRGGGGGGAEEEGGGRTRDGESWRKRFKALLH